jgi:hypothetical protein
MASTGLDRTTDASMVQFENCVADFSTTIIMDDFTAHALRSVNSGLISE